jgi:hypothetical protein
VSFIDEWINSLVHSRSGVSPSTDKKWAVKPGGTLKMCYT